MKGRKAAVGGAARTLEVDELRHILAFVSSTSTMKPDAKCAEQLSFGRSLYSNMPGLNTLDHGQGGRHSEVCTHSSTGSMCAAQAAHTGQRSEHVVGAGDGGGLGDVQPSML